MPVKTAYFSPSSENINILVEYLASISGDLLKLACIRQNIFKTRRKDKDSSLRNRCQIQAANIFLRNLLDNTKVADNEETITTIIAEIIPYIRVIDDKVDTSFMIDSTNTMPSTIHYKHAKWLFYHSQLPKDADRRYDLDLLVLYALRLALEKRILGFLMIDFIMVNRRPVGFSKLYPIIKGLESIEYKKEINWIEIELVNNWLNHFMHRHIRPYPWIIHQAFEVLNPLLEKGERKIGDQRYLSYYASTFVKDEVQYKKEIVDKILKQIPNAKIQWSNDKELLISKGT